MKTLFSLWRPMAAVAIIALSFALLDPREAMLALSVVGGAVTVAAVASPSGFIRRDRSIFRVTATADADTTATIAHGLGAAPEEVCPHWLAPEARISLWSETVASRDATNVVFTKATTAGSGAAGVQLEVVCGRPHTLGR